jgi:hypothetical protein
MYEVTGATSLRDRSADQRQDLEYDAILAGIRSELLLRFASPSDPGLALRRSRLRALFARVPPSRARQLLDRLSPRTSGDELSQLFHGRLATATRAELLEILARRAAARGGPTGPPIPRPPQVRPTASALEPAAAPYRPPRNLADWGELVRFRVPAEVLRQLADRSPRYVIQTIESAHSDDVNLDYYPVYVQEMPVVRGARLDAARLFHALRMDINRFIDTGLTEFSLVSAYDAVRWRSPNPRGAVFYLDLKGPFVRGPLSAVDLVPDNAFVACTDIGPNFWRFSTLTQFRRIRGRGGATAEAPDEHPVSGTREFGYSGTPARAVFYTKGADRGSWRSEWVNRQAFAGGHQLWQSFQRGLMRFVNANGGRAQTFMVGERGEPFISRRHNWWLVNRRLR